MPEALEKQHLADLHTLAAELGVEGYRKLRRDDLVREIEERGGGEATDALEAPKAEAEPSPEAEEGATDEEAADRRPVRLGRRRGRRGGREREREREREPEPERDTRDPDEQDTDEIIVEGTVLDDQAPGAVEVDAAGPRERRESRKDEPTEEVSGVLEILPQRYGFLRLRGLEPDPGDVYVSASQIRRCELRSGDEVAGPAREPRRGERHRALVHVDQVNGEAPMEEGRQGFEDLAPVLPERRLPLDADSGDVLARAADLLAPLALGQRVLVRAAARSGRTTLLRSIARAAVAAEGVEALVLLIDERPEEATAWREAVPEAQFAIATADLAPQEQVRIAELALERAQRLAETGTDAVLLVDSLSRLAYAAGDAAEVKALFGAGRNLSGGGSLTVVATVVEGSKDEGEADRAVATTESSLITLDPDLAADGVHPALRVAECRISNEEQVREPAELDAARKLRSLLGDLDRREAADLLRERLEGSATNAELLSSLG